MALINTHSHETEFGIVRIEEFAAPYTEAELIKVGLLATTNTRKTYQLNYSMGDDPSSLGYLLRNNKLESMYIAYLDDEFQFFSATRISDNRKEFLVLVRTFSKLERIKKPIHTAYILRLQMQLGKKLGFKECSFTMNIDERDGLAEIVKKRYLNYPHTPNCIKALAITNMSKFEYAGVQIINCCDQHVFTAMLND